MAKYYKPKLTKAQYFHVLLAMDSYGYDVLDNAEFSNNKSELRLHEQTNKALMKAEEK